MTQPDTEGIKDLLQFASGLLKTAHPEFSYFHDGSKPQIPYADSEGRQKVITYVMDSDTLEYVPLSTADLSGTGDGTTGFDEASKASLETLAFAMDKGLNMPLFVEQSNAPLKDIRQAQILSDAPEPIFFTSASAATPKIIDTTGYNSIVVHQLTAGITTPTTSNDQVTWLGMIGCTATAPQTLSATVAAAGVYVFPVTGRFIKLTGPATLVQAIVYLRQARVSPSTVTNVGYLAGTAPVTAGLAGTLAVGGNIATGVAPTTNPLMVGGVDAGRLVGIAALLTPKVRRALVDELGRFIPPNVELSSGLTFQNSASAYTKDISQIDGQSAIEFLYLILAELRVLTHQVYEMSAGQSVAALSEPSLLRTDFMKYAKEN